LDTKKILNLVRKIKQCKQNKGRIFFLGVGGSAANASHAVNDFRKIIGIEAYSPTDNVSELTARTNDEGWSSVFSEWLLISNLSKRDIIFIFSVGGGDLKKNISTNLVNAIKLAKKKKSTILSIVGKVDGFAAKNSDVSIIIPVKNKKLLTPFAEAYQAVIWHLLVSHPELKKNETMWESVTEKK
ncbi:SIS domain-containing protein, partial [Candidatus Pelagibacter bacterium]|nr:SIS domain-containing protein [Candidatus Pelagibacter bacterium]